MIKLLVVEDDRNFGFIIQSALEEIIGGYEVTVAENGKLGLEQWKENTFDAIVSDIEMPVMDGYEMVRRIREIDGDTPILFTSGLVSPKDVVKGYELGVNNYIKKPFLPDELDAHIQALLKMKQGGKSKDESYCYRIGKDYSLDAAHATLKHSSGSCKILTQREAGLLQMLCENKGNVVRREAILDKFWNTEDDFFASRSLDVFVTRIRKFFSEDPSVAIKTVKGVGLMLIDEI